MFLRCSKFHMVLHNLQCLVCCSPGVVLQGLYCSETKYFCFFFGHSILILKKKRKKWCWILYFAFWDFFFITINKGCSPVTACECRGSLLGSVITYHCKVIVIDRCRDQLSTWAPKSSQDELVLNIWNFIFTSCPSRLVISDWQGTDASCRLPSC